MPRTVFFVARTAQEVVEEIFYVFEGGDFGRCIRGDELRFLPSTDMCAGHKPGPMPRDGPHEARPHGVRHSQWNQTRALTFANSMALAQSQATPALHQTHHNIHTFTSSARQPENPKPARQTSRRQAWSLPGVRTPLMFLDMYRVLGRGGSLFLLQ